MRRGELTLLVRIALMALMLAAANGAQAEAEAKPPKIADQVSEALRLGDFAELERLYAEYGKPGVRSPSTGTEHLTHFWMGISQVFNSKLSVSEGYYLQTDALTRQWVRDHPQSVLAKLLHAKSLASHAWFFRGGGYANSVSSERWTQFGKYLNLALDVLLENEAFFAEDSSWNRLMLDIGRGKGWRIDQLLPVFENGIAKNPDDDALYFIMLTAMLPKWGGDLQTIERFIASVTKRTAEKRGMEFYARLYAGLSYEEVNQSLFSVTRASWPTMKAGFEDRLSRYPHTDHRNMYAYFACMARDRAALQEQLRLIDGAFERIFWGDRPDQALEDCKAQAWQD